eukprot:gene630-1295_t
MDSSATVEFVNPVLNKLQEVFLKYYKILNAKSDGKKKRAKEKLEVIDTWMSETNDGIKISKEMFKAVGDVAETVVKSITTITQGIENGDFIAIGQGCLDIAMKAADLASLLAGPFAPVVTAICSILSELFSLSGKNNGGTPDLCTQIANIVHEELEAFGDRQFAIEFEGLQSRLRFIMTDLSNIHDDENDDSTLKDMKDTHLIFTDFPQFIGEVSFEIKKFQPIKDNKTEADDEERFCRLVTLYSDACTCYLLLLSAVTHTFLAKSKDSDENPALAKQLRYIQTRFDGIVEDIKENLSFDPNDTRRSASANHLQLLGKVLILCRNPEVSDKVEALAQTFKMTNLRAKADQLSPLVSPGNTELPLGLYSRPHTKGDHHYFQVINHTDLAVKIHCGVVGDKLNSLKFTQDLLPFSSYERAAEDGWNFSTGGYFILYMDGVLRDDHSMFEGDVEVIKFALSNPSFGSDKSALMLSDSATAAGDDLFKNMNNYGEGPMYFHRADGKSYVLRCTCSKADSPPFSASENGNGNDFGKLYIYDSENGCKTWKFLIQKYYK